MHIPDGCSTQYLLPHGIQVHLLLSHASFFIISGVLFRPRTWYHTILAFAIPICLISPINWAIQYFIMGMDMSNTTWKEIISGVLHYRFDTRYNFFPGDWFIWTLVALRLIFGDIKHLYFMRNKKVYIPIAVLAVIYMALEPYIIDSQADFLNYTVERAIPCLPFFCIGLFLRDINFKPKDYPAWIIITLGTAALVLPAITGTCDIFYNTYGRSYLGNNIAVGTKKHTKNEQPNKVAHFHYIKFRFKYCSIVSLMIVFIFFSCSVTIRPFSIASWTITSVSPFC